MAEVREPNVIVPRTAVVAVPEQVTVSVIVIVPEAGTEAVKLTPAVNVTFCPRTTGFGEASSPTILGTGAAEAGSAMMAKYRMGRTAAARLWELIL